jgi:hypothetical protein
MLHTQTGGDGCGGGGVCGIDRALGWLHLQAEGGGEIDKGLEGFFFLFSSLFFSEKRRKEKKKRRVATDFRLRVGTRA